MKLIHIILGTSVFIFGYGLLNYYVGHRGWQFIKLLNLNLNVKLYWIIFWFIALSYILARATGFLPKAVSDGLTVLGSYWLAIMVYSFLVLVVIDLVKLLNKYLHFIPSSLLINHTFLLSVGFTALILILGIIFYGIYNARNPVITHYDIDVDKKAGISTDLHIAMASDIHLSKMVNNSDLEKMVAMINGLNPDIILLGGDIIDESVESFMERNMTSTLSKLKSKYGTYGVLGNHEYYAGHPDKVIEYYNSAGIKILKDQYTKIDNSFYLVGRENSAVTRQAAPLRKSLSDILKGVDGLPVFVIDHEPRAVKEAENSNINLMLSGHTHHGQLFPANLVTSILFETDWGHINRGNFNLIVTSGFGTWGPPIRIGNHPEVVDITVHFR